MRRTLLTLVTACLALLLVPAAAASAREKAPSQGYIVVYDGSVTSGEVSEETRQRERSSDFKSRFRYRRAVKGFAAKLGKRQVARLKRDPEVAFVSPDREVTAQAIAPLAAGESAPAGLQRLDLAAPTRTRQASSVGVAVIDSGVDLSHPDLDVVDGTNCITPGTPAQDDNGHGTHVAGTIAARNTGAGVVGVAPGTKLYSVKVLDAEGSGSWSEVICGIEWVTAHNAASAENVQVANLSLGGPGDPVRDCATTTDALHRAICRSTAAGVTYAVAAGNDGWDFDYPSVPDTPAAYPEVLTVAAMTDTDGQVAGAGSAPACEPTERDDRYASYSNYALTAAGKAHTIAAPGTCIRSTWPGGGYDTISGTSMATPHVAGAIALCLGEAGASGPCSGLTPAQIVQKIRSDAAARASTDLGYGFAGDPNHPAGTRYYGHLPWLGTSTAAYPVSNAILTGSLRAGDASRLRKDDNVYYEVNSTTSTTRVTTWYGRFTGVPATLQELRIAYRGKHSRSCSQRIALYSWTEARWIDVNVRTAGTAEAGLVVAPAGSLAKYVRNGELRARVNCSTSAGTFFSSGDLMRISYRTG